MSEPHRLPRTRSLRRVAMIVLWTIMILLVAIAANLFGIVVVGGTERWDRWLIDHRLHLFVWRVFLYAALAIGWWWMRTRVVNREASGKASARLRRAEISAVLAIALVETSTLLRDG